MKNLLTWQNTSFKSVYGPFKDAFDEVWRNVTKPEKIKTTEDALFYLKDFYKSEQEHFLGIYLNSSFRIITIKDITKGSNNSCTISRREIFKIGVRYNASYIIVGHNHPSGDLNVSATDLKETKALIQLGKDLELPILDHLIFSFTGYKSIMEEYSLK